jgi:tRNA dimethylallyltransferase
MTHQEPLSKKLIVVCGPTATGKSDLAVEIALEKNGEIISTDSRQVYTGLDLGTGKITADEMRGIPHFMLDIVDPTTTYSVAEFQKKALSHIEDIWSRGKLPILAGGTGMYIDSLTHDVEFSTVKPNPELRKKLSELSISELQEQLQKLDPRRFGDIDIENPVRLIRSIEIATELGHVPELKRLPREGWDIEYIYLDHEDDVLKDRITRRLDSRLEAGMLEEAISLHEAGLSYERMEELGLEYRFQAQHFQNKITYEEMKDLIRRESWKYVKRQRTWFKKYAK